MKKIYLPLFASLLLTSCLGDIRVTDSDNIDRRAIVEEIRNELRAELADISLQDTIYSTTYENADTVIVSGDTIIHAGDMVHKPIGVKSVSVDIPDIIVNISPDNGIEEAQRRQQKTILYILGITVPFGTIVLLGIILGIFLYKRMKSRNELISQAIEKGYELPDSFYNPSNSDTITPPGTPGDIKNIPPLPSEIRKRDSGLKYCLIAVAIIIIFGVWGNEDLAVIGVIPLLIGIGKLLTYYKIIK